MESTSSDLMRIVICAALAKSARAGKIQRLYFPVLFFFAVDAASAFASNVEVRKTF